jgi:hypothetical protein
MPIPLSGATQNADFEAGDVGYHPRPLEPERGQQLSVLPGELRRER